MLIIKLIKITGIIKFIPYNLKKINATGRYQAIRTFTQKPNT